MLLDHIAIWTKRPEELKNYYSTFFDGKPNNKYTNSESGFESYFLTFESGTRLEIMSKPGIPENKNDTIVKQHDGIMHFAFGVSSKKEVDNKAIQLANAGFRILNGPRRTGDGYYEFEKLDPDNNRLEVTTEDVE